MTNEPRVRAFVAVDLAPAVHEAVTRAKAELARVDSEVRWVRDAGLHVTVKFLGAVRQQLIEDVQHALARAARAVEPFVAHVQGLGAFPSLQRPRVLWAGMVAAQFVDLARAVDRELIPLGFAPEARTFHPHITLGRLTGRRGWTAVHTQVQQHRDARFGDSPVHALTLYRSDVQPGGAVYTALWTTRLGDSTRGGDNGLG